LEVSDPVALLGELGFGGYEARAYIALLKQGPLTGYQLARASGIPRANIYGVLRRLEERGAVVVVETESGRRYRAVDHRELLARLERSFEVRLGQVARALDRVIRTESPSYVYNFTGYASLIAQAGRLIESAERQAVVSGWEPELEQLGPALSLARDRGIALTLVCMSGCAAPCSQCPGRVYRYRLRRPGDCRWLLVVADGQELVAGQVEADGRVIGMTTRQPLLIAVATWYIRHTVAVAETVRALGPKLPGLLDAEARQALLEATAEHLPCGSWFEPGLWGGAAG
jgi:predicted transcriptional regulator